jgi:hypothetical protein
VQCLRSPSLGQDSEWLQKHRDKCSKSSYNTFHPYSGWTLLLTLFLAPGYFVCPLSRVCNSSHLLMHIPSSKTRPRRNDPPLMVREAPKEQTRPTDT